MSEEIKPVKPCRKCGSMDRSDNGRCRPCSKAYGAKWRADNPRNPEEIKASSAKYREENREEIKARQAKYREENREKKKESDAKYRAENPEKCKALLAEWRVKLKDSAAAKTFFQMLAGAAAIADYIKEQNDKKTA